MILSINLYLLAALVCILTLILFVPFINLLYRLKISDPQREKGRVDRFGDNVEIFDKIKGDKVGTPTGGGILIVLVVLVVFYLLKLFHIYKIFPAEFYLFTFTTLVFGVIGLFDDVKKVFKFRGLALRVRHKFVIQILAALLISYIGISNNLFFVGIPFLNIYIENPLALYFLSTVVITFMSNAFNILDGIDGLSSGSLLISLLAFSLFITKTSNSLTSLIFLYLLFGAVLAYLYFNIYPARLFMGDTGALSFGALLGVFTLTTGTLYLLPIFGIVYIVDALSSVVQWISKYFRNGKKVFKIAPIHHHFEAIGWESSKVVFRFWVIHAFVTLLGVGVFLLVG